MRRQTTPQSCRICYKRTMHTSGAHNGFTESVSQADIMTSNRSTKQRTETAARKGKFGELNQREKLAVYLWLTLSY